MSNTVQLDHNKLYKAWRAYMLEHSVAEHFGAFNDRSQAEFPYANMSVIGRPTNTTDLDNIEYTVDLTVQTDCYIDTMNITDLFNMDEACWGFFQSLGFRKMGDSVPTAIQNSNVKSMTSRFMMRNFAGKFLNELEI